MSKTKPGEGIRYNDGKSTFLRIPDYKRAKRLARKMELPINGLISLALKEYEAAHP